MIQLKILWTISRWDIELPILEDLIGFSSKWLSMEMFFRWNFSRINTKGSDSSYLVTGLGFPSEIAFPVEMAFLVKFCWRIKKEVILCYCWSPLAWSQSLYSFLFFWSLFLFSTSIYLRSLSCLFSQFSLSPLLLPIFPQFSLIFLFCSSVYSMWCVYIMGVCG